MFIRLDSRFRAFFYFNENSSGISGSLFTSRATNTNCRSIHLEHIARQTKMPDENNLSDVSRESAPTEVATVEQGNLQQPSVEVSEETSFDSPFKARAARVRERYEAEPDETAIADVPAEKPVEAIAEPEKPQEPDTEEVEKPNRVNRFKQLEGERDELRTQVETVNENLNRFGGIDGFKHIANVFDGFLSPNEKFTVEEEGENGEMVSREITGKELVYGFVNELPESEEIFSDFFIRGLENIDNRVFAVNDVLKQEFGLKPEISLNQDQFNTVFELLSAKLNLAKSPEEINKVFADFKFELDGLDYNSEEFTKDQEIKKLRAELEKAKNPQSSTEAANADPVKALEQSYETAIQTEQKKYAAEDELLVEKFTAVASEFLADYGLAANEKDSPQTKEAKSLLTDLLLGKKNIAQKVRFSPAFKQASGFLHKGTLKTHSGSIASNNLNNAMRIQVSELLEKLSPLIGGKTASPPINNDGKERASIATDQTLDEKLDFKSKSAKVRGQQGTVIS